jgi:BON domain
MTNKSIVRMALLAFSLMLTFNLGTYAQKTDCSKTTDDQIVSSIYAKIKVKYEAQMDHINVRITDGVVTLEGWATTKSVKKDIEKYAKKTGCVKSVLNMLTIGIGGGCGPGEKPCGGICIPSSAKCNISG